MKPKLYSKNTIAISTALLSPLLGSILFAYNLRAVGKSKVAPLTIIGGIILTVMLRKLAALITDHPLLQLLIGNGICGLVLAYLAWDAVLGSYTEYEANKNYKPIYVFVAICIALILFQLLLSAPSK